MVKVSHEQIKEILKTLPIGYYLGARTPVIYEQSGNSYCNIMDGTIHVSGETVMHGLVNLPIDTVPEEFENAIRAILYHELSHVILTPRTLKINASNRDWLNAFEDERIETLLSRYYLGVNFKRMCMAVNGWTEDWEPQDASTYFYGIVRFRQGPEHFVKRVSQLIRRWKDLRATSSSYTAGEYKDAIQRFWKEVEEDWYRNHQQRQQEQQQRNQQRQQQEQKDKQDKQDQQSGNGQSGKQDQQGNQQKQDGQSQNGQQGKNGQQDNQNKSGKDGVDKQNESGSDNDKDNDKGGADGDADEQKEGNDDSSGNGSNDDGDADGDQKEKGGDQDGDDESSAGENGEQGDGDGDDSDGDSEGQRGNDGSQESDGTPAHGNSTRRADGDDADEVPHDGKHSKKNGTNESTESSKDNGEANAEGEDEGEGEKSSDKGAEESAASREARERAEADNEREISEIDRDSIARDFDKLINHFADAQVGHILERLVIQHNKKRNLRTPMSLGYTGKIDLKSVATRQDYRWLSRKGGDGQNVFGSTHITLWVDCSGSFCEDVDKINAVIHELNKLARKMGREFSFDVVQMTMKNEVVPTTKQLEAMGCNGFGPGVEECIRKTRKTGCNNYNVVVWDGDMFSGFGFGSRERYLPVLRKAFNNQDTVIVTDGDNTSYINSCCPKARSKIVHGRYAEQFIGEMMKLLAQVLV